MKYKSSNTKIQQQNELRQTGLVAFYDIWPGNEWDYSQRKR